MSPVDRRWLLGMIAAPDTVWVTHRTRFRVLPRCPSEVGPFRRGRRLEHRLIEVIGDTHGRPTFELYRFQKQAEP